MMSVRNMYLLYNVLQNECYPAVVIKLSLTCTMTKYYDNFECQLFIIKIRYAYNSHNKERK